MTLYCYDDSGHPNWFLYWCDWYLYNNLETSATLTWNTPLRSNTGWRFDKPATQLITVKSLADSCGICDISLEIFTPDLTWDNTLWKPYDWVSTVCFPKSSNQHAFNSGVRGLGFFALLNKDADGLQSSWYGTVTLEPINGGKESSNLTSEYRVALSTTNADIFDKNPVTFMDTTTLRLSQKAV